MLITIKNFFAPSTYTHSSTRTLRLGKFKVQVHFTRRYNRPLPSFPSPRRWGYEGIVKVMLGWNDRNQFETGAGYKGGRTLFFGWFPKGLNSDGWRKDLRAVKVGWSGGRARWSTNVNQIPYVRS